MVGALVGQPQLARSAGCSSPATPTATCRRRARDADRRRGDRARSRRSPPRRPGASASSARRSAWPTAWAGAARAGRGALARRRFDRDLDWRWRRTSYSDITAGAYEARVASEPEERVVDDEAAMPRRRPPRRRSTTTGVSGAARRAVAAGRDAGRRRRSAPSCTACSRRPTSPRPTSTPSSASTSRRRWRAGSVDVGDPATRDRRPARRDRDAARAAARRRRALRDVERADRLDELELRAAAGRRRRADRRA